MRSESTARRGFFRHMARETLVWCEEMCGVRHVRLSHVAGFPPPVFAALIPRICPDVRITTDGERVCARVPGVADSLALFPIADNASLTIFNSFNGQTTIGQIADGIAGRMAWSPDESMARVRALFLRLLDLRVCVPCNNVPTEDERTTHGTS